MVVPLFCEETKLSRSYDYIPFLTPGVDIPMSSYNILQRILLVCNSSQFACFNELLEEYPGLCFGRLKSKLSCHPCSIYLIPNRLRVEVV